MSYIQKEGTTSTALHSYTLFPLSNYSVNTLKEGPYLIYFGNLYGV